MIRQTSDMNLKKKIYDIISRDDLDKNTLKLAIDSVFEEYHSYQQELRYQNDELKRLQIESDNIKQRYLNLYNNLPVGVVILDDEGDIVEINNALKHFLNIDFMDIQERSFSDFIYPEDQDKYYFFLRNLKNNYNLTKTILRLTGIVESTSHVFAIRQTYQGNRVIVLVVSIS